MGMKSNYSLKIGLLLVSLSCLLFTSYQLIKGTIYGSTVGWPFWILLTDTSALIGLAFRTVGSLIAVFAVFFYICKRDLTRSEATMTLRWILMTEIVYWLSLFLSGVLGMTSLTTSTFNEIFIIETGIPCLVESTLIPIVLVKLFFELNPGKSAKGAIKWGLISGTAYVFVFWLDNTVNWIVTIMQKGIEYISLYPVNLLSFGLTAFGLLLLTLYAAYISREYIGAEDFNNIDLRKIGSVIVTLGLYFDVIYVLWIFFGSVGGWGTWYAWFLGHNMNLWVLSLPLVGLPLLFRNKISLLYLVQGIGAVFVAVFSAAYLFALPSTRVLHGEPIFKVMLSLFGGLFLVLIVLSAVLSRLIKPEK